MASKWRDIKVFISSTFRDMHAERDHLVTVVFPELRERVEQLGLEFFDVDLRWGVPETGVDGENANSWEYCRRWIDRVEPFFVCMLGQRYGWVPKPHEIKDDDDRQLWAGRSVTDMEIRHAVLSRRVLRRSSFYLRETLVPEPPETDPAIFGEFVDTDHLSACNLEQLKTEIRTCGRPVRSYACRWAGKSFEDLDAFGRLVLDDLWSGVLRDERYVSKDIWRQALGADADADPRYTDESRPIPPELAAKLVALAMPQPQDPLDAEREQMEAFAQTRLRWFQGRTLELQRLTNFIWSSDEAPERLAVVAAAAGQGKSAFLARLWREITASDHSAIRDPQSAFVVTHFVGVTERSATAHELVQRLLDELDRSGIEWPADEQKEGQEPKRDFNSLCNRLGKRLGDYAGERRIVILLDALNQLTDEHDLHWLPNRLGPNVRIVVSCIARASPAGAHASAGPCRLKSVHQTDGVSEGDSAQTPEQRVLHALSTRRPALLRVPLGPLTETDIRTIVVAYLEEYCKQLDTAHVDTLCRMPQARNPLYLLVLLAELRTLGGNDMNMKVPGLIASMAMDHPDTVSLFKWVLERMENAEGFGREALRWWCLYLAHGRIGMASHELADLLARRFGVDARTKALRIERGLRRYLLRRGGQLDFFHSQLRQAVSEQCGPQAETSAIHSEIADYFRVLSDPENDGTWLSARHRPLEQLPYHLACAHRIEEMTGVLSDLAYLDARVVFSGPMSLLSDYSGVPVGSDVSMDAWRRFLLSNASSLRLVPSLLPSLAWYTGPPEIRRSADAYLRLTRHRHAWLKLDALPPVVPPTQDPADSIAPRFEIPASCDEIRTSVAAIAVDRGAGFYLKRIGCLGIVDFESSRVSEYDVRYPSMGRPLSMSASSDGRWLALVDEAGQCVCLELAWHQNDAFYPKVASKKMFTCLLPEVENPVVLFAQDRFWWQDESGHLSSWKVGGTETEQRGRLKGELGGLCEVAEDIVVLDRASGSASLLVCDSGYAVRHGPSIPPRIQKMCACPDQSLLLLAQDGTTQILSHPCEGGWNGPRVSGLVMTMASIPGGILFEMPDRSAFWSGRIGDPLVSMSPFKLGSGRILALAEDGDRLYVFKMATAFRAQRLGSEAPQPGPTPEMRIHGLCLDPSNTSYSALIESGGTLFATGPVPQQSRAFGKSSATTQAVANHGELAWPYAMGQLALWKPPHDPVVLTISGVGDILFLVAGAKGEYWITNADNEIWWVKADGRACKLASIQNLERPMPHRLVCGGEWLTWCGTSMGDPACQSADHLDTAVFFKIAGETGNRKLQPMGNHCFAPENGRWTLTLWDERTGEMAAFFQLLGTHRFRVRVGTPEKMLRGVEHVVDLALPEMLTDLIAGVPFADGRGWLVFTRGGWLVGLESGTYRMLGAYPLGVLGGIGTQARGACLVAAEATAAARCSLWDRTSAGQQKQREDDDQPAHT